VRLHRHYEHLLARSDELTGRERERLLAHLGNCERCREEQGAQREQDELLHRFSRAQPAVSLEAAVLARIRRGDASRLAPLPLPRLRPAPLAAGLVLAAVILIVAGIGMRQHLLPQPSAAASVAVRGNCTVAGASWTLEGPCLIVSSPDALRSPSVTYYPAAMQWATQHLHNTKYIVRRNDRLPVLIRHSGTTIYFSKVAEDKQAHRSIYVIGEQE
jgi:hypothetical protein